MLQYFGRTSDCLSLARDRKDIIVVIILLSHRKYMNDNWRPGEMVLGSGLGLAFE